MALNPAQFVAMALKMGAGIAKGLDPEIVADQVDRTIVAKGGDAVTVWRVVYELAHGRLQKHGVSSCSCSSSAPASRCLNCGGVARRIEVVRDA